MNALVLDFIRRWWWALLACVLTSALTVLAGTPLVIPPIGVVLLLMDVQRGGIRVMRCLPVETREQARSFWFAAVFIPIAASAIVMVPFAILRELLFPAGSHIWFQMAVQVWIAFGYAGFCFIIIVFMPTRPGESWREHLTGIVAGALWGFSISGVILTYPNLPRDPARMVTWHWVLLTLAPFAFIASYWFAEELLRRRSVPAKGTVLQAMEPQRITQHGGLTGIPLYLATVPMRAVALTVFVFVFQLIFLTVFLGGKGSGLSSAGSIGAVQTAFMGVMFASFTAMAVNIRALRVLPISSHLLATLLLSPAVGVGLLAAVFATLTGYGSAAQGGTVQGWELGLIVAGLGTIGLALMIRYPKTGVTFLIAGIAVATPVMVMVLTQARWLLQYTSLVGILLGLAGYLLLLRSLRRRSEVYQPRTIFAGGPWMQQQG